MFVGDFHQLRGMDATRATDSPRWQQVVKRHPRLELLRTSKPAKDQLHRLLRGHRAMPDRGPGYSPEPTNLDMDAMLQETPNTTFVTVTRRAAAVLNDLALEVLFSGMVPLATLAAEPESNLENYDHYGRLVGCAPSQMPIFVGARVTLTRNIDKSRDFVNGMSATVLAQ